MVAAYSLMSVTQTAYTSSIIESPLGFLGSVHSASSERPLQLLFLELQPVILGISLR